MASNTADDRFYTPRSSARRGYSSTGSEDERFFSPRESARSVSSDDNDYVTPRELSSSSIQTFPASEYKQNSSTIGYSYQQGHYNMTEMKNAYPDYEPNGYDNNSNSHHQYSQPQYYPQKYDPDYKDHQYRGYSDDHKKDAKQHHHYEYDQYGYETRSAQYVESHFSVPENDIFSATRHNRIDSVTYMLDQGVSVNSKDEYGNTILSIACQNGLKRMAKLALRRGANINSQNYRGNTALHFCYSYGYGETLGAYLISKGADTEIQNHDGYVCYYGIQQYSSLMKSYLRVKGTVRCLVREKKLHSNLRRTMVCERREHRDPMEYDEEMLRDENHHFNRQTTEEHLTDEHDTDLEEEMMRIDPLQLEWRRQLHVEDPIDAQNSFGNWCPAKISQIADEELHIEFLNMNPTWNRWIPIDSGCLAPYRTKAGNDSVPLRIAQEVEARRVAGSVMWKNAFIVKIRGDSVLVRYAGRQQEFDEWIPFSPDHLAPCGDHLQMRRTFVDQRRRLLINTSGKELEKKRPRIFVQGSSSFGSGSGQTNPRFLQYQNALRQNGLDLVSVEGDGNCLFRSISHQVYGDDKYHTLVRASCMDYMESEKEYFQPFVIGDMTHFIRYLNHKRQNGIWGDDPELQAMCELYDRPAEVYAYDPVHGYRKLRTFHENSTTLARNRPPIRLSYYGGGHYDSIVATDHLNNIIREPPGEWERRHLAYSRHINTRQVNSDSLTEESQLKALSDRESTEVAQLEQVLMLSRHEFDAMDSTIEDTLKLSLQEAGVSMTQYEETEQKQVEEAQRISEMASLQAELIEKARQVSEEEQLKKALQASIEHQKAFEEQEMKVEDPELAAAVAASLQEAPVGVYSFDEDEEIRRAMELSYQEYASTSIASSTTKEKQQQQEDFEDMDELQRAIQASLQEK